MGKLRSQRQGSSAPPAWPSTRPATEVTSAGVVSTFAPGFGNGPQHLAFDAAGNLFVSADNGTVSNVSTAVNVPFALGGTAVSGTDYSGVTASPLVFPSGTTTVNITGTLLSDPGANQTLTLTLGTPSANASVGATTVNTLTINEPEAPSFVVTTAADVVDYVMVVPFRWKNENILISGANWLPAFPHLGKGDEPISMALQARCAVFRLSWSVAVRPRAQCDCMRIVGLYTCQNQA